MPSVMVPAFRQFFNSIYQFYIALSCKESEEFMSNTVTINRENKSLLFCYIFGSEENKKYLLSLYNAVNNTNYTNIDDIEINTLSDIIYIRVKNDVSFLFDSCMSLYEHQSTFNPNMPLRGMMYFSTLYSQFLSENHKNIYGKTLVKIPTPRYIVFYNGNDNYPDRLELKLSDAFERPDNSGSFEWTATMLNINKGHNLNIMNKCQALSQYSAFVAKVKKYNQTRPIKEAINLAVEYAISNNYLDGFFKKHKEGIMLSCLTEFNEEVFRKGIHEEGYAEARSEDIIKAINIIKNLGSNKEVAIQQLMEQFELSSQEATKLVNSHWT